MVSSAAAQNFFALSLDALHILAAHEPNGH
jgi:hypothetical protein